MKKIITTIALSAFALTSFAGGLSSNTNQHSAFVRNPARYASLETDAIYFNPAGTAFFNEGWRISANWQMIWQNRNITSHADNKNYGAKIYVPVMPSAMASYTTGKWSFSGMFGITGGGGNAKFNEGLPTFNAMGNALVGPMGLSAKSSFESTQYLFSLQLGAAYRITDNLSAYVGLRGIPDRNAAELFRGKKLEGERDDAPELEEGQYYIVDIIGLSCESEEGEVLGTVVDVTNLSSDVYTLEKNGKKILFPAVNGVVVKVDIAGGKMIVDKKKFDEIAVD